MFSLPLEVFVKSVNVVQPRPPQAGVSELVAEVDVVRRPGSQLSSKSSYRNLSLLFSAAGWAELRQVVKRSRYEEKGAPYVKTALK